MAYTCSARYDEVCVDLPRRTKDRGYRVTRQREETYGLATHRSKLHRDFLQPAVNQLGQPVRR